MEHKNLKSLLESVLNKSSSKNKKRLRTFRLKKNGIGYVMDFQSQMLFKRKKGSPSLLKPMTTHLLEEVNSNIITCVELKTSLKVIIPLSYISMVKLVASK